MSARLMQRLADLKAQKRAGFVPFVMAGDPSVELTAEILKALPEHGADIIELGMPFSDPMADGPTIQAAAIRALDAHTHMDDVLNLVRQFRKHDDRTPIVLMGYYNPIFHRTVDRFMLEASTSGVDALIIVDLPIEEQEEVLDHANANQIAMIQLIAPTSLATRLPRLAAKAKAFVYYIAVKGITGDKSADYDALSGDISAIRAHCDLPIAVGFGIKTPHDVARVSQNADLVVVGSAIVAECEGDPISCVERVLERCKTLADGIHK